MGRFRSITQLPILIRSGWDNLYPVREEDAETFRALCRQL